MNVVIIGGNERISGKYQQICKAHVGVSVFYVKKSAVV